MKNLLQQFNSILTEGISQEDLAHLLYDRLDRRYPDIVTRYGHEVVGDTIDDVASFHAGAEELGSGDISIMIREILTRLEQYNQDIDETKGLPYPGTYEQENNMFKTSGPRHIVAMTNEEQCPHCGGEMVSEELMNEKKDACYYKVKSRYKVWPSAYASGALVKCRKKGASNWGTGGKSNESVAEGSLNEFAVSGDDNGGDDSLFNYAKMWYNGDLKTQRQVEKALQKSGLDIGENEDENGGAYISDMSGDYYESWTAEQLEQGVAEAVHPDILDKNISKEPIEKVRMGDFEFIARVFSGRIRGYGELKDKGLYIKAYDPKSQNVIGWAHFVVKSDEKGNQWLESADTLVDDDYVGRGVAAMMYAFAKSLGNDIKPSPHQSIFGKRMWKKWGKDAQHLVGEQGVAEGLEELRRRSKELATEWQKFNSTLEQKMKGMFIPLPTFKGRWGAPSMVAETDDRIVALAKINGVHVPFYISTGQGGKVNVLTGKWYPFFGISDSGWFNKGSEEDILKYYGSSKLKGVAEWLNNNVGNLMALGEEKDFFPVFDQQKTTQAINQDLSPPPRVPSTKDAFKKPLPNGQEIFNQLNKQFEENVNNILIRIGSEPYYKNTEKKSDTTDAPMRVPTAVPSIPVTGKEITGPLTLSFNGKQFTVFNISGNLGRANVKQLGDDYRFWSDNQFELKRDSKDGTWVLVPNMAATNKTMINGNAATSPTKLKQGMVIAVGNPEKKIQKLPITVGGKVVAEDQLDEKWSKKYKDSINCSNPKGFSQKAHCAGKKKNESSIAKGIEQVDENLHQWFKEKWVRFGPDGKIRGDCARGDDSEGKPKCLPQAKAHALGKKGRKYAAAKKRREDPNPERRGPAKNVATKKKSNESINRRGFLRGLGAAAAASAAGGALAQTKDLSADLSNMNSNDPRIQHNKDVNELAKAIYDNMVNERGQPMDRTQQQKWFALARNQAEQKLAQYAPGKPQPQQSSGFSSQGSEVRRSRNFFNFESEQQGMMEQELDEACWKGYHKEGNKKMFGKTYPNRVKNKK